MYEAWAAMIKSKSASFFFVFMAAIFHYYVRNVLTLWEQLQLD